MTIEALQKNFQRFIKSKDTIFGLWLLPTCLVLVAISRLLAAQLTSRWPDRNYNFDVVHHWPGIIRWLLTPQRLLMLFAILFAITMSLVAFAQKNQRLRVLMFSVAMAGTLFLEWSAEYVVKSCPWLYQPRKANVMGEVDFQAAKDAYRIFGLGRYSIPEMLIPTQVYYEQRYVQFKDVYLEDGCVRVTGDTPLGWDLTIGPAQMKKSKVIELVREFPSELKDLAEAQPSGNHLSVNLRAALNKRNAAMLVGAYNASVIRRLEKGEPACADASPSTNQTIANLWKNGDTNSRTMALAISHNPLSPPHGRLLMEDLRRMEAWYPAGKVQTDEHLNHRAR